MPRAFNETCGSGSHFTLKIQYRNLLIITKQFTKLSCDEAPSEMFQAQLTIQRLNSLSTVYKNSVRTSQETYYVSATKTNRLRLYGETVAVYCEHHMKHINTLCGQNKEFLVF
jgi:hypothetical protein